MKTWLVVLLFLCLSTASFSRAAEAGGISDNAHVSLLGFEMPGSDMLDRAGERVSNVGRKIKESIAAFEEAIHEKLIEISNWFQDMKREYAD